MSARVGLANERCETMANFGGMWWKRRIQTVVFPKRKRKNGWLGCEPFHREADPKAQFYAAAGRAMYVDRLFSGGGGRLSLLALGWHARLDASPSLWHVWCTCALERAIHIYSLQDYCVIYNCSDYTH